MLRGWQHLQPKKKSKTYMPARSWKLSKWQLIQSQKFKKMNLTYISQSSDPSEIKIFSKWELLPFKNLKWWKLLPAKICHKGGNSQMSKFKMLQTFTCMPKIAGLQVESISNLRTSTVGRTHISQKNRKGFLHQTRLVGRHTREFNLYSLFFVRNMVGVLFLHHVPSTKNNPEIS